MNLPPLDFASAEVTHLQPGQAAEISFNGVRVGSIGRLAETIAGQFKFRQPIFIAEVDLTALLEIEELPVLYSPLPRFPSILRDVSLLLDRKITVAELLRAVHDQKVEYFVGAKFVGTYEGEGIPEGKRSVTLRFEYRADDRTLRDEEVDELHWPRVKALAEKFSHLEDKIYRTIELTKALRQEKEDLERELVTLRSRAGARDQLVAENERLLAEREAIRIKVQRILEKIDAVDPEIAEAISG